MQLDCSEKKMIFPVDGMINSSVFHDVFIMLNLAKEVGFQPYGMRKMALAFS